MQVPKIRDLTEAFRTLKWTGDSLQDEALCDESIRCIDRGVYVHYLQNDHKHPIHDRNGEKRGRGKLLVLPWLSTIKFGKFEDGLVKRRLLDVHHFHRRDPASLQSRLEAAPRPRYDTAPKTFAECVRFALVLDLTGCETVTIRDAESTLRMRIREFLAELSLSVQDHRGDYRILKQAPPPEIVPRLEQWSRHVFAEIADRTVQ